MGDCFEVKSSLPWIIFNNKLKALFEDDPEVEVNQVVPYSKKDDTIIASLIINTKSVEKAMAIERLMPESVEFDGCIVEIAIGVDCEKYLTESEALKVLFTGNPIVKNVVTEPEESVVFVEDTVNIPIDENEYKAYKYADLLKEVFLLQP